MTRSSGLTAIELLIVIATTGAFLRLAIPNVKELITRASDASASAVYADLRDKLVEVSNDPDGAATSMFFNQIGGERLPKPFERIELSKGIRVNYLISLHYPGFFDLLALEVSHERGSKYYRYVEINNKRVEQTLVR